MREKIKGCQARNEKLIVLIDDLTSEGRSVFESLPELANDYIDDAIHLR